MRVVSLIRGSDALYSLCALEIRHFSHARSVYTRPNFIFFAFKA